jgi:hypothetical protein
MPGLDTVRMIRFFFFPEGLLITCSYDYLTDDWNHKSFILYAFICNYVFPMLTVIFFYSQIVKVSVLKINFFLHGHSPEKCVAMKFMTYLMLAGKTGAYPIGALVNSNLVWILCKNISDFEKSLVLLTQDVNVLN